MITNRSSHRNVVLPPIPQNCIDVLGLKLNLMEEEMHQDDVDRILHSYLDTTTRYTILKRDIYRKRSGRVQLLFGDNHVEWRYIKATGDTEYPCYVWSIDYPSEMGPAVTIYNDVDSPRTMENIRIEIYIENGCLHNNVKAAFHDYKFNHLEYFDHGFRSRRDSPAYFTPVREEYWLNGVPFRTHPLPNVVIFDSNHNPVCHKWLNAYGELHAPPGQCSVLRFGKMVYPFPTMEFHVNGQLSRAENEGPAVQTVRNPGQPDECVTETFYNNGVIGRDPRKGPAVISTTKIPLNSEQYPRTSVEIDHCHRLRCIYSKDGEIANTSNNAPNVMIVIQQNNDYTNIHKCASSDQVNNYMETKIPTDDSDNVQRVSPNSVSHILASISKRPDNVTDTPTGTAAEPPAIYSDNNVMGVIQVRLNKTRNYHDLPAFRVICNNKKYAEIIFKELMAAIPRELERMSSENRMRGLHKGNTLAEVKGVLPCIHELWGIVSACEENSRFTFDLHIDRKTCQVSKFQGPAVYFVSVAPTMFLADDIKITRMYFVNGCRIEGPDHLRCMQRNAFLAGLHPRIGANSGLKPLARASATNPEKVREIERLISFHLIPLS